MEYSSVPSLYMSPTITGGSEKPSPEATRTLLMKVQTFVVGTRLYLAVIAAMESLAISILLGYPLTLSPLIFSLLTFSVYLNDQILDFNLDDIDREHTEEFIGEYYDELYIIGAVAYGIALSLSALGGPLAFVVTLIPGTAWILYAADLVRSVTDRIGFSFSVLKDIFLLNTTIVAVAWSSVLGILPLAFANAPVSPRFITVIMYFFVRVWVNTETSNLPDVNADQAAGVATLPTEFSVSTARSILFGLNLLTLLGLVGIVEAGLLPTLFATVLALGPVYSSAVIAFSSWDRSPRITQIAEFEFAVVFVVLAVITTSRGQSLTYMPGQVVPAIAGFVLLLAVGLGAAAAILAWREHPEPGALPIVVMLVGGVWWAATLFVEFQATNPAVIQAASNIGWVGVVMIPVGWLLFALEYTGRTRWLQPRYVSAIAVVPILTVFLAITAPYNTLLYRGYEAITVNGVLYLNKTPGPWYWVITGYTYLLGGSGVFLLLRLIVSNQFISRRQALTLVVGTLVPWVTNIAFVTGQIPIKGLDPTPLAFVVTNVAYLGAMTRFKLLQSTPTPSRNAPRLAFERMGLAAIVIDRNEFIVEVNDAACELFDMEPENLLGNSCEEALPSLQASINLTEGPADQIISISEAPHRAVVTPVTDPYNRTVSYIVTLTDISGYLRRQEQLRVLNRTFRHNVRTKLQLLVGIEADGGVKGSETNRGGRVDNSLNIDPNRVVKDIDKVGSKVRDMIRVFELEHDNKTIRLDSTVDSAISKQQQSFPETTFETEPAPPARVNKISQFVIDNAIQNASEHNTNTTPRVAVTYNPDGDSITVSITDNGPGIDKDQLSVLQQRNETDVQHLNGLGLWLIIWGMEIINGEVSFEQNNPRGTTVKLKIPVIEWE